MSDADSWPRADWPFDEAKVVAMCVHRPGVAAAVLGVALTVLEGRLTRQALDGYADIIDQLRTTREAAG